MENEETPRSARSVVSAKSERLRQWAVGISSVLGLLLVILPWQFWRDAIDGALFHVTLLGISGYLLSTVCVGAVLYGLVSSRHHSIPSAWTLVSAGVLVVLPVLKWVAIVRWGLELFHNRMGLGQEIAGFIPNALIDGVLWLVSLGLFAVLLRCRSQRVRRDLTPKPYSCEP